MFIKLLKFLFWTILLMLVFLSGFWTSSRNILKDLDLSQEMKFLSELGSLISSMDHPQLFWGALVLGFLVGIITSALLAKTFIKVLVGKPLLHNQSSRNHAVTEIELETLTEKIVAGIRASEKELGTLIQKKLSESQMTKENLEILIQKKFAETTPKEYPLASKVQYYNERDLEVLIEKKLVEDVMNNEAFQVIVQKEVKKVGISNKQLQTLVQQEISKERKAEISWSMDQLISDMKSRGDDSQRSTSSSPIQSK